MYFQYVANLAFIRSDKNKIDDNIIDFDSYNRGYMFSISHDQLLVVLGIYS